MNTQEELITWLPHVIKKNQAWEDISSSVAWLCYNTGAGIGCFDYIKELIDNISNSIEDLNDNPEAWSRYDLSDGDFYELVGALGLS